jgi:pre-mRNA cleavage complex 2 protein Pcf11
VLIVFVIRQHSGIIPFLYERMPIQCKQCAIRFPEGQGGKKQMEDHLDMHFRQNRKASENIGRGHSRSWFVGADVSSLSLSLVFEVSLTLMDRRTG